MLASRFSFIFRRYKLPGECYINVFMAILGVILFNDMTGRTVNEKGGGIGRPLVP